MTGYISRDIRLRRERVVQQLVLDDPALLLSASGALINLPLLYRVAEYFGDNPSHCMFVLRPNLTPLRVTQNTVWIGLRREVLGD